MWKRLKVYGMSHLTWMGGNLGHYTWDGQLLRKKGKLLIGNDVELRHQLLEWMHSSIQGGHSGMQATYQSSRSQFWLERMIKDVQDFIEHCDTFAR